MLMDCHFGILKCRLEAVLTILVLRGEDGLIYEISPNHVCRTILCSVPFRNTGKINIWNTVCG